MFPRVFRAILGIVFFFATVAVALICGYNIVNVFVRPLSRTFDPDKVLFICALGTGILCLILVKVGFFGRVWRSTRNWIKTGR